MAAVKQTADRRDEEKDKNTKTSHKNKVFDRNTETTWKWVCSFISFVNCQWMLIFQRPNEWTKWERMSRALCLMENICEEVGEMTILCITDTDSKTICISKISSIFCHLVVVIMCIVHAMECNARWNESIRAYNVEKGIQIFECFGELRLRNLPSTA